MKKQRPYNKKPHKSRVRTRRLVLPILHEEYFVLSDERSGSTIRLNTFKSLEGDTRIAFEVPSTIRVKTERSLMQ